MRFIFAVSLPWRMRKQFKSLLKDFGELYESLLKRVEDFGRAPRDALHSTKLRRHRYDDQC